MYTIEKNAWGFMLTFSGFIAAEEMQRWLEDSARELHCCKASFGVIVDMRHMIPLPGDAQKHMTEGQKMYKAKGMERSAVVLGNPVTAMQFRRMAKGTGIDMSERYVDATAIGDWERLCMDWVLEGKEPV